MAIKATLTELASIGAFLLCKPFVYLGFYFTHEWKADSEEKAAVISMIFYGAIVLIAAQGHFADSFGKVALFLSILVGIPLLVTGIRAYVFFFKKQKIQRSPQFEKKMEQWHMQKEAIHRQRQANNLETQLAAIPLSAPVKKHRM